MKIELCASSIEAIKLAHELNFDRIELCQNLDQGGITPSPGFIEYALAYDVETHVLIRPRTGGFKYSADEVEIMMRDINECIQMGVQGVVVGALNEYGMIDSETIDLMRNKAKDLELTFHRAFDDCADWEKGMEQLINIGVDRILTSGTARNVEIGYPILEKMVTEANGRIQIMAGGGVNAVNCVKLKNELHPDAIHFSGTTKQLTDESSLFAESVLVVDENRVKRILEAIRND